ncbi:MAG TPA: PqqD family protein [Polyangiaceae bacterium]|nr:PqqD family protein [Polyangiaceae bacterium]
MANELLGALSGAESIEQCDRTASRVIDGKAVIITIDRNELHVLNDVGTFVWQLADGRSLSAIADEVVQEFDVDREQATLDVCAFAQQLCSVGAVTLSKRKD